LPQGISILNYIKGFIEEQSPISVFWGSEREEERTKSRRLNIMTITDRIKISLKGGFV